nr:hypothetical protein [uncultured archaeon]
MSCTMVKREDYINKLTQYVKNNLKKGYTLESLKWALVSQGHSRMEVAKAIERVESELSQEAPVLQTKPEIVYETEPSVDEKKPWYKRILGL